MQAYANFTPDGNFEVCYVDVIHGDSIPDTAFPITNEEWREYVANGSKYKRVNGVVRMKTQEELDADEAAKPPVETYISPIERRLADVEMALADVFTGGGV